MIQNTVAWTESQLAAINVRAPKILVSAAAGSGKSSVLTERVIRSVTRETEPNDIADILAVTFTRAAAAELRIKIGNALRRASLSAPKNKRLSDQLLKLPSARISTIDGMCASLIRNHFQSLGISAGFRVADEGEINAIRLSVMSEMIENAYSGLIDKVPDFGGMVLNFVSERDTKLADTFLSVYDRMRTEPDFESRWLSSVSALGDEKAFSSSVFSRILCDNISIRFGRYLKAYESCFKSLECDAAFSASYLPAMRADVRYMEKVLDAAGSGDYPALIPTLCDYMPERLGSIKAKDSTEDIAAAKTVRDSFKSAVKKLIEQNSFSETDIINTSKETRSVSLQLLEFIKAFHAAFSAEKKKRSVMDYADLEDYALKLLYSDIENKVVSKTAESISGSLDEIYVDEYQDISPVQDMIFRALSVKCPIFMVGDIKQSIYNFRGASPDIFSFYRRTFEPYEKGKDEYPDGVTVFLSDNFRSESAVTEFANAVSDAMFGCTPEGEEELYSYRIPYCKSDRLVPKKKETDPENAGVTFLICNPDPDFDYGDTSENASSAVFPEAETVANRIYGLISKGVSPDDIAILLRSQKDRAEVFEYSLRKRGIPVYSESGNNIFDTPEIKLTLCILNCIDNPYQDIFLAGALRSPVFGFTLDELITVRSHSGKGTSLYTALCAFAEKTGNVKANYFLDFLSKMRKYSEENTVDRLIWQVYSETAFFSVIYDGGDVMPSGAALRRANLLKLHSLGKEFTSSGREGLYPFMERIRLLTEGTSKPTGVSLPGEGVRILTMHHSKGLEFGHCFVCDLSYSGKANEDVRKELVTGRSTGAVMKLRDVLGVTRTDTPARLAVALENDKYSADEEIRILYVALTRAKTHLYLSGRTDDPEELRLLTERNAKVPHPDTYYSLDSYLSRILTAVKTATELSPRFNEEIYKSDEILARTQEILSEISSPVSAAEAVGYTEELYKTIAEKLAFSYPYSGTEKIPGKLSVSKLYPEILDEDAYEINVTLSDIPADASEKPDNSPNLREPVFLSGEKRFSGADKGTATHVFMQFCSFENVEKIGIDAEIERLTEKKFILPFHKELIDRAAVKKFFSSPLYNEMKRSERLSREYRFNVKFPAKDFTSDEKTKEKLGSESVFVQGVIDCYFIKQDGTVCLIDYKTDRVPADVFGQKEKEDAFFNERHGNQLKYYKTALEKLTGKAVTTVLVYSFALGRQIDIKT